MLSYYKLFWLKMVYFCKLITNNTKIFRVNFIIRYLSFKYSNLWTMFLQLYSPICSIKELHLLYSKTKYMFNIYICHYLYNSQYLITIINCYKMYNIHFIYIFKKIFIKAFIELPIPENAEIRVSA